MFKKQRDERWFKNWQPPARAVRHYEAPKKHMESSQENLEAEDDPVELTVSQKNWNKGKSYKKMLLKSDFMELKKKMI